MSVPSGTQIIGQSTQISGPGLVTFNYLLWLTPPTVIPVPGFRSQYLNIAAPDLAAFQAGTAVEESYSLQLPNTLASSEVKNVISAHWVGRQNYYNTLVGNGPSAMNNVIYSTLTGWSA